MLYVAIKKQKKMPIYFFQKVLIGTQDKSKVQSKAQNRAQVGAVLLDKAPIIILTKYFDYSNVFLVENIAELPKHTKINGYIIKLEKYKLLFFSFIYSLKSIEFETLKTYIKTNLTNKFIWLFKSPIGISIFFN